MPLFVIVCMLMTMVAVDLVFNHNYFLSQDGIAGFSILRPEVNAATGDNAVTQVTVRNAPPAVTVEAAEWPASTSTSPINVGDSIQFTMTGDDPEDNSYYMIVCPTPGVVASSTGGAPECDDGLNTHFCISPLTPDTEVATCTYASVADPPGETQDWYAYLCDNHGTEGSCTDNYSQGDGAGDDDSPFYINHAPNFTAVNTTGDDKDPGQLYTILASVTDSDKLYTLDELSLYVCSSDSWDVSTGCTDDQFCYATSTTDDIECQWATTTPARDGDYPYYAFVKDDNDFAATGNSQTDTYTVNNVAPTVSGVHLHSDEDIILNMKNSAEVVATTTATIADNNTCHDIVSATSSIYWSGAAGGWNCVGDGDDCYQISAVNCAYVPGSCVGTSTTATYICSTTLAFHAIPTDGGGGTYPYTGTSWLAGLKGIDDDGAYGIGTTTSGSGVAVATLLALTVQENLIDYGSIRGGEDTGTYDATTTIENYGNAPIDSTFSGDNMAQPSVDYIAPTEQRYGLATDTYASLTYQLASSTSAVRDLDIGKPDDDVSLTVTDQVFWGINIPAGKPSGVYSGTNYFMSALDNNAW